MNKLFILLTAIFFLTIRAGLQWLTNKTMFQNEPNGSLLRQTIKHERELSMTPLIHLSIDTIDTQSLTVVYQIEHTENEILHIILVQRQVVTNVQRGENVGHQLHHVNVVGDFKSVPLQGSASGTIRLDLPERLTSKEVTVIAFTQDKTSMAITGAGELSIK